MIVAKIVIQSLEDAKRGKAIVKGAIPYKTNDFTIGILEAGMQSGKTSLMFVLEDSNKKHVMAEMSAAQFKMMIGAVRGAVERFGR